MPRALDDIDQRLESARNEFQQRLADIKRDLLLGQQKKPAAAAAAVAAEASSESGSSSALGEDGLTGQARQLRDSLAVFFDKLYPPATQERLGGESAADANSDVSGATTHTLHTVGGSSSQRSSLGRSAGVPAPADSALTAGGDRYSLIGGGGPVPSPVQPVNASPAAVDVDVDVDAVTGGLSGDMSRGAATATAAAAARGRAWSAHYQQPPASSLDDSVSSSSSELPPRDRFRRAANRGLHKAYLALERLPGAPLAALCSHRGGGDGLADAAHFRRSLRQLGAADRLNLSAVEVDAVMRLIGNSGGPGMVSLHTFLDRAFAARLEEVRAVLVAAVLSTPSLSSQWKHSIQAAGDDGGYITFQDFLRAVRRGAGLTAQEVTDEELRHTFEFMDGDRCVQYVPPPPR
jgi:hypothetical protein